MATRVVNRQRLVLEANIDIRKARGSLSQRRVELRLMEIPVARPVMLPGAVGTATYHEGLTGGVDEVHPLR